MIQSNSGVLAAKQALMALARKLMAGGPVLVEHDSERGVLTVTNMVTTDFDEYECSVTDLLDMVS